jgi:hypothetical protein
LVVGEPTSSRPTADNDPAEISLMLAIADMLQDVRKVTVQPLPKRFQVFKNIAAVSLGDQAVVSWDDNAGVPGDKRLHPKGKKNLKFLDPVTWRS